MSTATAGKLRGAGNTRRQVLDTALRLFTQDGFFNTSVHDIARASGVSVGSIYHHFKDKEGIARALYADLVERMVAALEAVERGHPDTAGRCRAIVAMLFELTEDEPETMEFMIYAKHREFLPGESPVCSSRPFTMMREMISAGMARGEVRSMDPMVASTSVFGGPIRMITARLDGVIDRPLPEFLDEVWDCSWRAVAS